MRDTLISWTFLALSSSYTIYLVYLRSTRKTLLAKYKKGSAAHESTMKWLGIRRLLLALAITLLCLLNVLFVHRPGEHFDLATLIAFLFIIVVTFTICAYIAYIFFVRGTKPKNN